MNTLLRENFNKRFSEKKYEELLNKCDIYFGDKCTFRIAESPVFISDDFKEKLLLAADEIVEQLLLPEFKAHSSKVFGFGVPNVLYETSNTEFLQLDFGVCKGENGELTPKLIELQGFPSLYFFQQGLSELFKEVYELDESLTHLFNGYDKEKYFNLLKKVILNGHAPGNVVLLDIDPWHQNTKIDFFKTSEVLGIPILDITDIEVSGRDLYYTDKNGAKKAIHRIYNRVIFDELLASGNDFNSYFFSKDNNVEWAGHPNWFAKISKHSMPFLKGKFIPETTIVSDLTSIPDDLENYVLKPLFSFSGAGITFNIKKEDITHLKNPENYVLQRKEEYVPFVRNNVENEWTKAEIRLMFLWPIGQDRPELVCNLMRMSKGEMVGVKYNKNKNWVGASIGLFNS